MENNKKANSKAFREVRDPQLNVATIVESLEAKIPYQPKEKIDWKSLTMVSYKPESPLGFRKFDPAGTAHLFEKGIAAPKFTNPKLWFIRGPIKTFVGKLVELYGLFDKKISENRVRAFFAVLHELVRLGKRLDHLEHRLDEHYQDEIRKSPIDATPHFGWATQSYFSDSALDNNWDVAIAEMDPKSSLLVLFPEWGAILKKLSLAGVSFEAVTTNSQEKSFIESKITGKICFAEQLFPLKNLDVEYQNILIYLPLYRFPSYLLERLFVEVASNLSSGSYFYFSLYGSQDSGKSPFVDLCVSEIREDELPSYLKKLGFQDPRDLSFSEERKIFRYTKI